MTDGHSVAVLLLVIVIVVQQIQLLSVNKKIKRLFEAYVKMCEVSEKQFVSIKQIISYVTDQTDAIQRFFDAVTDAIAKDGGHSNDD